MLTHRTCEIIRIYHLQIILFPMLSFHNLNRPVFQTELKIGENPNLCSSVVYTSANVQNGIEESGFQLEEATCKVQIDNGAIDHSETFDPNSFQISNSSRCL